MTAKEAQAFLGDVQYVVRLLQDDKLFLETPSSPPRAHSTQVDVKVRPQKDKRMTQCYGGHGPTVLFH